MASSCSAHSSDPSEVGRINEFFQGFQPTDAPLSGEVYDGVLRHSTDGCTSALLEVPEGSQSHASNLAALPDGTLGLVWFNGDEEGVHNVILFAQLSVGSDRWSHPVQVSGEPSRSAQNPVLFYDEPSACLMVLHTSQAAHEGQATAEVRLVTSSDGGRSWGSPVVIFRQKGAFTKNQLLRSRRGEWLLPMYYTPEGFFQHASQYSSLRRSVDGHTWADEEVVLPGTMGGLVQPTIVRTPPHGSLRCFFRSRAADYIFTSESTDDGHNWSSAVPTTLPSNNSGIQACQLSSGALAMVFNNVRGAHARSPLTIALSVDHGASFVRARDLETGGGEMSYPSIVQTPDGTIHLSYTYRRRTIKYTVLTEGWVRKGGAYQPPAT